MLNGRGRALLSTFLQVRGAAEAGTNRPLELGTFRSARHAERIRAAARHVPSPTPNPTHTIASRTQSDQSTAIDDGPAVLGEALAC